MLSAFLLRSHSPRSLKQSMLWTYAVTFCHLQINFCDKELWSNQNFLRHSCKLNIWTVREAICDNANYTMYQQALNANCFSFKNMVWKNWIMYSPQEVLHFWRTCGPRERPCSPHLGTRLQYRHSGNTTMQKCNRAAKHISVYVVLYSNSVRKWEFRIKLGQQNFKYKLINCVY
jgi:hypothetical protein